MVIRFRPSIPTESHRDRFAVQASRTRRDRSRKSSAHCRMLTCGVGNSTGTMWGLATRTKALRVVSGGGGRAFFGRGAAHLVLYSSQQWIAVGRLSSLGLPRSRQRRFWTASVRTLIDPCCVSVQAHIAHVEGPESDLQGCRIVSQSEIVASRVDESRIYNP
jgi:hypothetical protein